MNLKRQLSELIAKISPQLYFRCAYFYNRGHFPNLYRPKDISEVLIKQVLDGTVDSMAFLADKYQVRDFIKRKGLAHLLTPLIKVYSNPDEINFNTLPDKFAIKMNYGAGMNIICTDKNKLDFELARQTLRKWLDKKYYSSVEKHYNLIPRKIIVEEFIDDGTGGFPTDYKFMCIYGKVFCILACNARETGHASYAPFDINWNYIAEYDKLHRAYTVIPKPKNLSKMIDIAETISQGFGIVRIDLFSNGSKIWFGEITLTPSGCILHGWTQKALDDMGNQYCNQR